MSNRFKDFFQYLFVIFACFLTLPILVLAGVISLILQPAISRRRNKFTKGYKQFLREHNGKEFFCYTAANVSLDAIETYLLPILSDKNIEIIKISERIPETNLNSKYVSHMLFSIRNIQFPTMLKIANGYVIDAALNDKLREVIDTNDQAMLTTVLETSLLELKQYASSVEA